MKAAKPYMLRAIHEWLTDSDCTPYLLVNADLPYVDVPREHVKDGRIVLNVSLGACAHFLIDDQAVSFSARFAGQPRDIYVPIGAVEALYARENGEGMSFEVEALEEAPESPEPEKPEAKGKVSHLKVVK
ncbi:ClpXP protease specificity-enhancing factor [Salinibius halmophilus]|uniref:ClpXP protease specificity-enhancing factor n=1 Tax=Salinibius halmophilus TaxID=1853216 RepID=UPI000E65EF39|nr:ClpXP protease specificity-enhancing factor [Salinibius halmophilus]